MSRTSGIEWGAESGRSREHHDAAGASNPKAATPSSSVAAVQNLGDWPNDRKVADVREQIDGMKTIDLAISVS